MKKVAGNCLTRLKLYPGECSVDTWKNHERKKRNKAKSSTNSSEVSFMRWLSIYAVGIACLDEAYRKIFKA